MTYNICGVFIRITAPAVVSSYLEREFSSFRSHETSHPDLTIEIRAQKPETETENLLRIEARDHITFYTVRTNGVQKEICVLIPYPLNDSLIEKMTNPFFMTKWQRCLIDFFHNPFLCMFQLALLERDATFLHASAYCDSSGRATALAGAGRSGKSTILKWVAGQKNMLVLSEDFCVLRTDGQIFAYPKQCRVLADELALTTYASWGKDHVAFWDRLHLRLLSLFRRRGFAPKRRLCMDELYPEEKRAAYADLQRILLLQREGGCLKVQACANEDFCMRLVEIMRAEFENLASVPELLQVLGKDMDALLADTRRVLYAVCCQQTCRVFFIPYYEQKETARREIIPCLLGESAC